MPGLLIPIFGPNLYMQGLLLFKELIRSKSLIMAPVGGARVSVVDVRDIAMVAVIALTESGHQNKTYDITGPESLTHADLAAQLSKALGKSIGFQNISSSEMREALLGFHMAEWQADGLVEDYEQYKRGEAGTVSDTVKKITGPSARSFRSFADDFKSAFQSKQFGYAGKRTRAKDENRQNRPGCGHHQ